MGKTDRWDGFARLVYRGERTQGKGKCQENPRSCPNNNSTKGAAVLRSALKAPKQEVIFGSSGPKVPIH